jgi:hypothetical protein
VLALTVPLFDILTQQKQSSRFDRDSARTKVFAMTVLLFDILIKQKQSSRLISLIGIPIQQKTSILNSVNNKKINSTVRASTLVRAEALAEMSA